MLFALALAVPIGLLIFNWIATLWGGALQLRAAPLFALGAISSMTIGPRRRARLLRDPGRLAARQHHGRPGRHASPCWWAARCSAASPRSTTGSRSSPAGLLGEGLGKIALLRRSSPASTSTALAMFFAGLKGQPVDIYKYFAGSGLDGFNLVASIARLRARRRDPGRARATSAHSWRHGVRSRPRPLGRRDARVVRALAAAGAQLRRRPRRAQRPSRCTTSAGRSATAPRRGARRPSQAPEAGAREAEAGQRRTPPKARR